MSKYINAETFLKLYKLANGGVESDFVIELINALPDEGEATEDTEKKLRPEETEQTVSPSDMRGIIAASKEKSAGPEGLLRAIFGSLNDEEDDEDRKENNSEAENARQQHIKEVLTRDETKKLLEEICYEISTQAAWSGHEYGFEYLKDYFYSLRSLLFECDMSTSKLAISYIRAKRAYINTYEKGAVTREKKERLEECDKCFVAEMYKATTMLLNLVKRCIPDEKEMREPAGEKAENKPEEVAVLCGFVYRHGFRDYSVWNVELQKNDMKKIVEILEKYETEGCSVRNAYDMPLSEAF